MVKSRKRAKPGTTTTSQLPVAPTLPLEGFVSIKTVTAFFATSKSTLWRWIGEGKFPRPKLIGPGSSRFDVLELRAHIEKIRGGAA
jgi:predicted DNA-binding transcriptional regulator AlpA